MKKIIVIGSFGCGNKGDDAILDGLRNVLEGRCKLIPTSGTYGGIDALFQSHTEYMPLRLNEGFSVRVLFSAVQFLLRYSFKLPHADAVIIGGGSLIHDLTPYNLPFYFLLQKIAGFRKVPVYYIGVGAGPLRSQKAKKKLKRYLNKSSGVLVRDPVDYRLLQSIGVKHMVLSADTAFAGQTGGCDVRGILGENGMAPHDYIVVTACQWFESANFWHRERMDFEQKTVHLKKSIENIHRVTNKKIVFLPTVMHDFTLGEKLKGYIASDWFVLLSDHYNCREMAAIIENSYFVYGMRMHSIIFAVRAGVPFIAVIYDEKVRHLAKRIGMEDFVLDFQDIGTDRLEQAVARLMRDYGPIQSKLRRIAAKWKGKVSENIEKMLLSKKDCEKS